MIHATSAHTVKSKALLYRSGSVKTALNYRSAE